jgi:pantothenate kinase
MSPIVLPVSRPGTSGHYVPVSDAGAGLSWDALVARAATLADSATADRRAVLGITGAPGAGKSTVSAALVAELTASGRRVVLVGMDAFHLAQVELERLGRTPRKGAPDTFDADGYVTLLRRLRTREQRTVYAPVFRRDLEEPVACAVPVHPEADLVVTEGNYLLHDDGEWTQVRGVLDECWYVDVDDALRRERLAARHLSHGRSADEAWARTMGSDEVNARAVAASRARADLVVTPEVAAPIDRHTRR